MRYLKGHLLFSGLFILTIVIILFPMIFLGQTFLYGDNAVQFYPWFKAYSQALKGLTLPFWVSSMQCGFPLVAEGQVGAFYPFNLLVFFLLPFDLAYNFSIILHFILAGVFIYLFTRKLGAGQLGGYISALVFCFGSAFGGCFYNIITLRTLSWFPVVLLGLEYYLEKRRRSFLLLVGLIAGMQFLAGFIQLASYSLLFYLVYYLSRAYSLRIRLKEVLCSILVFLATTLLLSLPQLMLTYQLVKYSGRLSATLGFALWKSFNPVGIFGLVFPFSLQAVASSIYIGIPSLFFVIYALIGAKRQEIKALLIVFSLSLFCALGWFNPFFVILLKVFKFYIFRNPSKFLFFTAFSLAVLAGMGFSRFFEQEDGRLKAKAIRYFRTGVLFALIFFVIFFISLKLFKPLFMHLGEWLVRNFITNQPYHRYDSGEYLARLNALYERLQAYFSFLSAYNLWAWVLAICAFFFLPKLLNRKNKAVIIALLFLDIFIFSLFGSGFRGNLRPLSYLRPQCPAIYNYLKADRQLFRILPFDIKGERLPNWAIPNANMSYGIDSIGAYAPLASSGYRQALLGLEVVDDSLGLRNPRQDSLQEYKELLRLLNVKYIVSALWLQYDFLQEITKENGIRLYRLKESLPRVFFTKGLILPLSQFPTGKLKVIKYRYGYLKVELDTNEAGYLVFSEAYYPGWKATVNCLPAEIRKVSGLLQAVFVEPGKKEVEFRFSPLRR